jgi:arylsulfatase A-like enzyme
VKPHRWLAVLALVGVIDSAAAANRPNILLIQADDLGYGDLGCYGQKKIKTPNLDRLAQSGLRFTDYYAGSTVCAPSRCCLMTGRHTGHARIRGNGRAITLQPTDATVAKLLRDAGYATACIGKWGLGWTDQSGHANRQGFDHFFGYTDHVHAHNYFPDFLWRNAQKIHTRNEIDWPEDAKWLERGGVARIKADYSPDLCLKEALAWLDEHGRAESRPFFLYFASTLPHANNEARTEGMEVPELGDYAATDWPAPQKAHAAMISRLDRDVGSLLEKLAALGAEANTLVVFTSDNGPHREGGANPEFFDSNGPLRGLKRDLYEGGIRVPMIARWPGRIQPATTTGTPLAHWDFLPTACELAGITAPIGIDGVSFEPVLVGQPAPQRQDDFLYWEFFEGEPRFAIRQANWKAIFWNGGAKRAELYDLSSDPGESTDLAAKFPVVVSKLKDLALSARTPSENEKWNFAAAPTR